MAFRGRHQLALPAALQGAALAVCAWQARASELPVAPSRYRARWQADSGGVSPQGGIAEGTSGGGVAVRAGLTAEPTTLPLSAGARLTLFRLSKTTFSVANDRGGSVDYDVSSEVDHPLFADLAFGYHPCFPGVCARIEGSFGVGQLSHRGQARAGGFESSKTSSAWGLSHGADVSVAFSIAPKLAIVLGAQRRQLWAWQLPVFEARPLGDGRWVNRGVGGALYYFYLGLERSGGADGALRPSGAPR